MANKQRGAVKIKLDKERTLRYTLNAIAELEDKLGITIDKLGDLQLSAKTVQIILWAGLIHEDETLTIKQVGDMVDFENLEYVQEKIAEAFALAQPKNQ
jgi:uncharacterized protein YkvS